MNKFRNIILGGMIALGLFSCSKTIYYIDTVNINKDTIFYYDSFIDGDWEEDIKYWNLPDLGVWDTVDIDWDLIDTLRIDW
jgi:hypothetical protein